MENKGRLIQILVPTAALGLAAIACNTSFDAALNQEYYTSSTESFRQNNPGLYQATLDAARMTQQALNTPEPDYSRSVEESPLVGSPSCSVISNQETVSHILEQMGIWPGPNSIEGGIPTSVAVYRNGIRITDPVAITDALKGGTAVDSVDVGDEVCVGNPSDLLRRPTPTPQSKLPGRMQMSQRGFSPSKGSQPARPTTFRRA